MIEKILLWYSVKRKPIGITIAILALITSVLDFINGNLAFAIFQLVVGVLIIYDVRTMKNEH